MRLLALFILAALQVSVIDGYQYYWTDWNNGATWNSGYKTTGKIVTSTTNVDVTFTSTGAIAGLQYGLSSDIDYFEPNPANTAFPHISGTTNAYVSNQVSNRPPLKDIIRLNYKTTVTLAFSTPIVDPVLALMSTDGNTYEFTSAFKILTMSGSPHDGILHDNGYTGNGKWTTSFDETLAKYKLVTSTKAGETEPHGTIQLIGTFSSISWTTSANENWHGFTIGVRGTQTEALAGTGVGPAQNTKTCTSVGDPHVLSFAGKKFDCHVAGPRTYYSTVSNGITTSVDTNHTAVPSKPKIMVNNEAYVFVSGIGRIKANATGQVLFIPISGPTIDYTLTPSSCSNQWTLIAPGLYYIRNPFGVAKKHGVYVANAHLTVYFTRATWKDAIFWNVEIVAHTMSGDAGLCVDESCKTTPTTPDPCPNNIPTTAQINQACLDAVQSSVDPLYTFCVADVSNACDLTVALTFVPPFSPPAPLTPNSPVVGDPQFVGLQGQSYQVHGADDTVFALLSTPRMQMNGLFSYIGVGGDCNYHDTPCWSHPGTYISQLGFRVAHHDGSEDQLHFISGSHSQGLHILLNGQKKNLNESFWLGSSVRVHIKSASRVHVHIHDLFIIDITNSDHFFNMAVQLLRRDWLAAGAKRVKLTETSPASALAVYPDVELHGLLGITWRNVVYPHNRVYEGDVMDYAMESHDMFDTDFPYSMYEEVQTTNE